MPRRVQRSIKKRVVAGENAADLRVIVEELPLLSKYAVAHAILDRVLARL